MNPAADPDRPADEAEPACPPYRSEAFAEDVYDLVGAVPVLRPGRGPGQRRYLTQVLSWMIGSRTASTINITIAPIATINSGSSTVASAIARR